MKIKLTLAKQITIIFIAAFIITTVMLGIFLTRNLNDIYENTMYDSLEAEGKTIRFFINTQEYNPAENISFIRFGESDADYVASDNINEYIGEKSIPLLMKKVQLQKDTSARYVNKIDGKAIYYIILKYEGFFEILEKENIIVLTDSAIKNKLVRDTSIRLFVYCFIAFLIGYVIILVWSRFLIGSIKKIRRGISKMGASHYETRIALKRRDELGQLVDSVNTMSAKIAQSEKTKQEMLQGISHDLKTPVAVIRSYAEAVLDGMSDPKTAAQITVKQTKRLDEKVTNLLNLTRLDYIGTNKDTFSTQRMDIVIRDLIKAYIYQTDVQFELALEDVSFDGDAESWRIAIENILDNAIRYAKTKIVITLKQDHLGIFNDGKKIEEDYLPAIFLPYEKSRSGKFGLGLSIVYKTVSLFGYKIKVMNEKGGVSFSIYR